MNIKLITAFGGLCLIICILWNLYFNYASSQVSSALIKNYQAFTDIEQEEETPVTRKVIKVNETRKRTLGKDKNGELVIIELIERDCIDLGPINCNPIPTINILPIDDIENIENL